MELHSSVAMKDFGARKLFQTILIVGLFAMAARGLTDPDLGWHLRTGEFIVQSGSVPHSDFYSFTNFGKPWIAHEWLSEVLMYIAYAAGKWLGLLVETGAVMVAAFWVLYKRCTAKPYIAGIVTILCAMATLPFCGPRPQIFSILLTSIFLLLLDRFAEGNRKVIWLAVPSTAIWVNLHGGFAIGIGLIVLTATGLLLEALFKQRDRAEVRKEVAQLALVTAACLLVVPLNPNGLRMYSYPLETLHSTAIQGYIQEWASPNFHDSTAQPFALVLLATFATIAISGRRVGPRELLLLLIGSYAGLRSLRHIPLFALIAGPIFAANLQAILSKWKRSEWLSSPQESPVPLGKSVANLTIAALLAAICIARLVTWAAQQPRVQADKIPTAAVDFIIENRVPAPIYNNYDWGGYLIWRLYPDYKVFVDGRSDLYGDAFLKEVVDTYTARGDWKPVFSRFGIKSVCVGRNAPLATILRGQAEWRKVFEDEQAVIFVRNELSPIQASLAR